MPRHKERCVVLNAESWSSRKCDNISSCLCQKSNSTKDDTIGEYTSQEVTSGKLSIELKLLM